MIIISLLFQNVFKTKLVEYIILNTVRTAYTCNFDDHVTNLCTKSCIKIHLKSYK